MSRVRETVLGEIIARMVPFIRLHATNERKR